MTDKNTKSPAIMSVKEMVELVQGELTPLLIEENKRYFEYLMNIKKMKMTNYSEYEKQDITRKDRDLIDWSSAVIQEKVNKMAQQQVEAIATKMTGKLKGIKVTSVKLLENTIYDIEFLINDTRFFSINTIQAGGYNIQCLHYRTTYKLHN